MKNKEQALAFVVKTQGAWSCEALTEFRESMAIDAAELDHALADAREVFLDGPAKMFLCNGAACRKRRKFEIAQVMDSKDLVDAEVQCQLTECQGPCKFAPIATLRAGAQCSMFAEFFDQQDMRRILEFTVRAAKARTLLVHVGDSRPYHFDVAHEHEPSSNRLQPIEFLLGHFAGKGSCPSKNYNFAKEVVGTWEVGGRFIALRMAATYELKSGLKDRHQALVMLGINPETSDFQSRAYTDGGFIRDFQMSIDDNKIVFADSIPHGTQATRARKVLAPSANGYDEILELDYGDGKYVPYYHVQLERQS